MIVRLESMVKSVLDALLNQYIEMGWSILEMPRVAHIEIPLHENTALLELTRRYPSSFAELVFGEEVQGVSHVEYIPLEEFKGMQVLGSDVHVRFLDIHTALVESRGSDDVDFPSISEYSDSHLGWVRLGLLRHSSDVDLDGHEHHDWRSPLMRGGIKPTNWSFVHSV